ncbi:hypothetical protein ACS0TY_012830 [Phlomoides rotata]
MRSETPLDYAVFHLSPKRSRCELFVSSDGSTEKLASGLLKPFVSHLQIAEEQVNSAAQSIKLDVGRHKNAETWFTKGTLERFVRFVSTPEALELVNTLDAEMSQLEAARRIYLQGAGGQVSGGGRSGVTTGGDATKKELARAIDVRLVAVREDLSTACARAAAAGFNIDSVSQLEMFAQKFGAHRLNEACANFISLNERRPELTQPWRSGLDDQAVRSSYGSDMSIDDDPPSPPPRRQPATSRPLDPLLVTFPKLSRESSVETEKDESSTPDQVGSIQASQPARRLSVQDRINMFENKQKENSSGKPVVVKPVELRRLSSDVSSSGAAVVLRRWSGASDMSIDLSFEKKDTGSSLSTPSSSAVVSQDKEFSNLGFEFNKSNSNLAGESDVLKDQVGGLTQSRSEGQERSEDSFNTLDTGKKEGVLGFRDQGRLTGTQMTGVNNQVSSSTQIRPSVSKGEERFKTANQKEGSESRDESIKEVRVNATQRVAVESGVVEDGPGSRIRKAFASRYKDIEGDSSSSQKEVRSLRETEVAEKKESQMSEKVSSFEDSGPRRSKLNKQGLTNEPSKKKRDQRDETSSSGNNRAQLSGQVAIEAQEGVDSFSTPPLEQDQRVRQKGNQELNNELKMKASELEKLFAEHKLRVPGDQSNSARKGRSGDTRREPSSSLHYTKQVADVAPQFSGNFLKNTTSLNASSPMTAIDSQYDSDAMITKFSDLSVSESSRGKFYDRYMQKRNAKLQEDWNTNREEKEARSKSLWDSLERNRSEMKSKITGSEDRQDAVSSAHQRAARLRSYNSRSIMKREQQRLDFGDSEDDDEALDFPQQNHPHENKALDDPLSRDGSSSGAQGKKHLPSNKSFSSTRTSAAPVPRSAMKNSTISSGKRRMLLENPLAQSVPNFSDMKKEITKPSSGANKTTRLQVKSYTRSKSTKDDAAIVRDDKSLRSQSLRKSSANPNELGEMSPVDTDVVGFTPVKLYEEVLKNAVTKPFLKKGSRTSFIARTTSPKEKASGVSELINNQENCDMDSGPDEFVVVVKDEDEEEFESLNTEGQSGLDNGEPKHVLEPEKFENSGSENGDDTLTFSLVDQALGSKLPIDSSFHPVESIPDWSGESPVSWNSQTQHPFSYPHEMSDVDASVESPVESPASWNSHSLNQIENDAARMRKKWGAAQKPMLAVHSSNNQSHKDMTRGFKRLLKFGRKSRGSESLVDWISATTSEGDDDTEDGRDPANRSSDDLRKSRMGFSHAQASEDSFNETEFFNESVQSSRNSIPAPPSNFKLREDHMSGSSIKAPRSFFSLSTFRSKGSDSKLR